MADPNCNLPYDHPKLAAYRAAFGRDVLGPIFLDFCAKLRLFEASYAGRNAKALYVARGGLRLRLLFNRFLERHKLSEPTPQADFWTSRLGACKGCLVRDFDYTAQILAREFSYTSLGRMIQCLLPRGTDGSRPYPAPDHIIDQAHLDAPVSAELFAIAYRSQGPVGQMLRDHFESQHHLFNRYIEQLAAGAGKLLLVDTGWTGNTQALLMRSFPQIDWVGMYFGRWDYRKARPWHFYNTFGLVCEGEDFVPDLPETAFFLYHHIIESPLEISVRSVEGYVEEAGGRVVPDGIDIDNVDLGEGQSDELFHGILEYFNNADPNASDRRIAADAQRALRRASRIIRFPTRTAVSALTMPPRSADFGKDEHTGVLLPAKPGEHWRQRFTRVKAALWHQGQIVGEFPRVYPLAQLAYDGRKSPLAQRLKRILRSTPKSMGAGG